MNSFLRKGAVLAIAVAIGYFAHGVTPDTSLSAVTVAAPPANSVRVLYSLDAKQNDQQIIALINDAQTKIYFAIYEFTLKDIADALVAAKKRGVEVQGLVDKGESSGSYDASVIAELKAAGIPIETEVHPDGNGIMHIKAIVTDKAYALGSYNWTSSATKENDELLEIGTDPTLRGTYETILSGLIQKYSATRTTAETTTATGNTASGGTYTYTDAKNHIGETASVTGTMLSTNTSKSGTVFLEFCKDYKTCPFTAVIFADNAKQFTNLDSYAGQNLTLTGQISSYQGNAEMVLSDPSQIASGK